MKKIYDVFISYSRWNLDKVKAIKKEIEQVTGAECWMDLNAIESGATQFTQDIVDGINSCSVFLFMLSEESQDSKFALRELNFAMKKNEEDKQKHVVIVNIDDCHLTDEFEFMYGLTDTIVWNNQPQREKLLRDVSKWIEERAGMYIEEHDDRAITDNNQSSCKEKISSYVKSKPIRWFITVIVKLFKWLTSMINEFIRLFLSFFAKPIKWLLYIILLGLSIILIIYWLLPLTPDTQPKTEDIMLYEVKDSLSGLYGFMDETGKLVIPYKWKGANHFSEGLGGVKDSTDQYGFVDSIGTLIIPCQWKLAGGFHEGLAQVANEQWLWGYIDKEGKEVIPCKWETTRNFCDGLAWVEDEEGLRGYIDKSSKTVIPFLWHLTHDFSEGLAAVCDQATSNWGFIDKTGKLVIPYQWMNAYSFSNGLAHVMDGHGNHYYIDKTGNVMISCIGEYAWSFSEGLVAWESDTGRYGYVDTKGKTVIPCQWKLARDFSDGFAAVMDDNNKWGYIDKTGKLVIPCQWKDANEFTGSLARVEDDNGRCWWINKTGKVVGER